MKKLLTGIKSDIAQVTVFCLLVIIPIVLIFSVLFSRYVAGSYSTSEHLLVLFAVLLLLSVLVGNFFFFKRLQYRDIDELCETLVRFSEERGHHLFVPDGASNKSSAIEFHFKQLMDQNTQLSLELHETEKIYTSILNTQEELVFIIDNDGYISYRNRSFDEIFGAPSLDFDRESSVFSENLSSLMQEISPIINDKHVAGRPNQFHFDVKVDGKVRHIVWAINHLPEVEPGKTLFVGRDETNELEIRNNNERLQKIATVGRAASTIFHEINQPLSIMHISTFMIKNALDSVEDHISSSVKSELIHNAEIIESQIERSNQIVSNLRLFHSGGKKKLVYETFPLRELVDVALSAVEKEAQQFDINLVLDPGSTDSVIVPGNKTLFVQVLVNLLKNAIQALMESPYDVPARIEIGSVLNDNTVTVSIEDNGPGIPATDLLKVTEPFYTTKSEGSGLGLALCLDILNSYRGHLDLVNVEPHGVRASVSFPISDTAG